MRQALLLMILGPVPALAPPARADWSPDVMCESFFATLECECLDRQRFKTQREGRMAVFDFIVGFYNPHRRRSALGNQSPVNYERKRRAEAA